MSLRQYPASLVGEQTHCLGPARVDTQDVHVNGSNLGLARVGDFAKARPEWDQPLY
jgi:hypothetical protein